MVTKSTVFSYKVKEKEKTKKIDFIFDTQDNYIVFFKNIGTFRVKKFEDEFTDNPEVQIRHVYLEEVNDLNNKAQIL